MSEINYEKEYNILVNEIKKDINYLEEKANEYFRCGNRCQIPLLILKTLPYPMDRGTCDSDQGIQPSLKSSLPCLRSALVCLEVPITAFEWSDAGPGRTPEV